MRRLLAAAFLLIAVAQIAAAPLKVEQVAPGVYVHFGQHKDVGQGYDGDIANIGFVIGRDAVAVIETGGSCKVGVALKEALRAVTALPVRYVINTHIHPDHIFGNAAFIDAGGAGQPPQLIGHAMLPRALALRGGLYLRNLRSQLGDAAAGSAVIAPTHTVATTLVLDLGGRKLDLTAWPGAHTDNDLTVADRATGTLWTGDLLFIDRTPVIDGDIKGWIAATGALQNTPATLVIPGHGPATGDRKTALMRQARYLTTLLRDVRAGIAAGAGMAATMETAAAAERTHWQLFDVVNRRNVNLIYPQLEWE